MQYILNLRLQKAEKLLQESNTSIVKISEMCGFQDSFYFSKCFKHRYGLSPLNYRKYGI